jgi:SAM-dependent MidA family methyltransferase
MERLDAFMARANAAYYATHDFWTEFATAPEISQAFGEILGLWAALAWRAMGAPDPVLLAEAGPGRGTLMADALRAARQAAPDFAAALRLHLVETSPRLRALAAARLPQASWHERVEDVPPGPLLLLANEFLDALPVRQFARRPEGWSERHVAGGRFVDVACAAPGDASCGDPPVLERGEAAEALVARLAARLAAQGGAALFLDYGPERELAGDSLQALRWGRPADPLAEPGGADLTAHVAFPRLARVAEAAGAAVQGPVPQGLFLARLGLFQRLDRLARGRPAAQAMALMQGGRRLAEPDAMGQVFKAFAMRAPGLPELPGFAE